MRSSKPLTRFHWPFVWLFLWALPWLVAAPSSAQFLTGPKFAGTTSFELGAEPAVPFAAGSVDVRVQGQAQSVTAIERIAVSEVLIYLDLPLSTKEGLALATEALAARASQLVNLGPVRLVSGSVVPEELLAPTRDALHLQEALEDAGFLFEEGGEILDLREQMIDLATNQPERWETEIHELLVREHDVVDWQFQTLLEQLTEVPGQENRVLFLVQNGFDLSPLETLRKKTSLSARFERRALVGDPARQRELGRTLAAEGWFVVPINLSERPQTESEDDSQNPGPIPGIGSLLEEWTSASGSQIADSEAGLDQVLERLKLRYRIRWNGSQLIDDPAPIDLLFAAADVSPTWRRWTSTVTPPMMVAARAERYLSDSLSEEAESNEDSQNQKQGVIAVLLHDGEKEGTLDGAILQVQLKEPFVIDSTPGSILGGRFRFTLVSKGVDSPAARIVSRGDGEVLGQSGLALQYQNRVSIPSDFQVAALVVEDLESRQSAMTLVGLSDRALPTPTIRNNRSTATATAQSRPGTPPNNTQSPNDLQSASTEKKPEASPSLSQPSSGPGTAPPSTPRATKARSDDNSLVQIVPPRRQNLEGQIEIKTLVTNPAIRAVRFLLDGKEVAIDERAPFGSKIDLGSGVKQHEIVAIALSRSGIEMGSDTYAVNKPGIREGVFLTRVDRATDGALDVAASLTLPADTKLDRLEFYRNQLRVATLTSGPFETRLPGGATGPADFVRVVAWSKEGRFFEDVFMLDGQGTTDRVEVNLVQVYAVVTDKSGTPVKGLESADFRLKRKGDVQEINRFAVAEEVPLVLGLVIDTSGSMMMIMQDTKRAATTFIGDTLSPIDKGFVVDFDNQPRLAQGVTGEIFELMSSLGSLEAEGSTALYDSIVFSLLQFGEHRGRHALVLLSDGDDYRSRFGFKRTLNDAQAAGVPIYVLELSGLDPERPSFRKDDLETLSSESGGRVFYAKSMTDVTSAYKVISEELRNQYVLGFSTDRALSPEELSKIVVEVEGKGRLEVRATVGQLSN